MDSYNAFADLLNTFRLSPDWIKALWLLMFPLCLAILTGSTIRTLSGLFRKNRTTQLQNSPSHTENPALISGRAEEMPVIEHAPRSKDALPF